MDTRLLVAYNYMFKKFILVRLMLLYICRVPSQDTAVAQLQSSDLSMLIPFHVSLMYILFPPTVILSLTSSQPPSKPFASPFSSSYSRLATCSQSWASPYTRPQPGYSLPLHRRLAE